MLGAAFRLAHRDVLALLEAVLGEAMQRLVVGVALGVRDHPLAAPVLDLADGIALAFPEAVHRRHFRRRLERLLVDATVGLQRQHHLVAVAVAAFREVAAARDFDADSLPAHISRPLNARSGSAAGWCRPPAGWRHP